MIIISDKSRKYYYAGELATGHMSRPHSHSTGLSLLIWTKYANKCCSKRSPMMKTNGWRRNASIASAVAEKQCIWIGSTLGWCCWWIVDRNEDFFIICSCSHFLQTRMAMPLCDSSMGSFLLLGKDCTAHQVNGNMSTKVIPWHECRRCYPLFDTSSSHVRQNSSLYQCRLS